MINEAQTVHKGVSYNLVKSQLFELRVFFVQGATLHLVFSSSWERSC